MKNLTTRILLIAILFLPGSGCSRFIAMMFNQYQEYGCKMPGEKDPVSPNDYIHRAALHAAKSETSCQFFACDHAVKIDPRNVEAYECRSYAYEVRHDYANALGDITTAIGLPFVPDESGVANNHRLYHSRADLYEKDHQFDEAIADYNKEIELLFDKTDKQLVTLDISDVYLAKGQPDQALAMVNSVIADDAKFYPAYYHRADLYRRMGKDDLADADEKTGNQEELAQTGKIYSPWPKASPAVSPSGSTTSAKTISGGVLNGKAITLPKPDYPPAARAVHASGAVSVQVLLDESGRIISASAVGGHPLLREAAKTAAMGARFPPTLLNGQPVKVSGIITYNFPAQ